MAMALATVSMAILPTYQQVGLWAPIALVLLRILQGLSAGGEYTTSIVFLAEHAQPIAAAGHDLGALGIGVGHAAGLGRWNTALQQLERRPNAQLGLAPSLCPGAVGGPHRSGFAPRPAAAKRRRLAARPLQDLARHRGAVLRVLLLNVASSVAFYTAFVYVITYIQSEAGQRERCTGPQHPRDGIAADLLPNRRMDLGSAWA